jgi:hypothetical protein
MSGLRSGRERETRGTGHWQRRGRAPDCRTPCSRSYVHTGGPRAPPSSPWPSSSAAAALAIVVLRPRLPGEARCLPRPHPGRGPTRRALGCPGGPPRPARARPNCPPSPPGRSSERSAGRATPRSVRSRSGSQWSSNGRVPTRSRCLPTGASCSSRAGRTGDESGSRPVATAACGSPPPARGGSRSGATDDPPAASIGVVPPLAPWVPSVQRGTAKPDVWALAACHPALHSPSTDAAPGIRRSPP